MSPSPSNPSRRMPIQLRMHPASPAGRAAAYVAVALLVLVGAPAAGGTTISIDATNGLVVTAADGAIDATFSGGYDNGALAITIDDSAPIVVGESCSITPDPTIATCRWELSYQSGASRPLNKATFTGGDGADRMVLVGRFARGYAHFGEVHVDSGAGADEVDLRRINLDPDLTVHLGPDNDTARGCPNCYIFADDGWDTIEWDAPVKRGSNRAIGFEHVRASSGDDTIHGAIAQTYELGAGNDEFTTYATTAQEVVHLGAGNDTLNLRSDRTSRLVHGGPGRDTVHADSTTRSGAFVCLDERPRICGKFDGVRASRTRIGDDFEIAAGGVGSDVLVGSRRDNQLGTKWEDGDDVLVAGLGRDTYIGGPGWDVVTYEYVFMQPGPVRVVHDGRRNDGSRGEDLIHRSVEVIGGTRFNDTLVSRLRGVALVGLGGNDRLTGGRWPDYLDGGAGNDTVRARGGGKDTVRCGPGRDVVFADRRDEVASNCERVHR